MVAVTHDVNLLSHAAPGEWADRLCVVGLQGGVLRFKLALSSPTLAEALSELFAVGMKALDVDGARHFVVTGEGV